MLPAVELICPAAAESEAHRIDMPCACCSLTCIE